MLIGSRSGFVTLADREEAMYKQALEGWMDLFADRLTTFEDDFMEELNTAVFTGTNRSVSRVDVTLNALTTVGFSNSFQGSFLKSLSCPNLTTIKGGQQFQDSKQLVSVSFPKLSSVTDFNWFFYGCTSLKTVDLGLVTSLRNGYAGSFGNCTALTDVFFSAMTTSGLLSHTNIMTSSLPNQIVFHCADGNVIYDGSAWVVAQNLNGGGHKCLNSSFSPFPRSSRLWKEAA